MLEGIVALAIHYSRTLGHKGVRRWWPGNRIHKAPLLFDLVFSAVGRGLGVVIVAGEESETRRAKNQLWRRVRKTGEADTNAMETKRSGRETKTSGERPTGTNAWIGGSTKSLFSRLLSSFTKCAATSVHYAEKVKQTRVVCVRYRFRIPGPGYVRQTVTSPSDRRPHTHKRTSVLAVGSDLDLLVQKSWGGPYVYLNTHGLRLGGTVTKGSGV